MSYHLGHLLLIGILSALGSEVSQPVFFSNFVSDALYIRSILAIFSLSGTIPVSSDIFIICVNVEVYYIWIL